MHDSSLKKSTVRKSVQPSMVVVVDVVEPDVATRPASSAAAAAAAAAAARFTGDPARPGPQFLATSAGEGEGGWFPAPQPLKSGSVRGCGARIPNEVLQAVTYAAVLTDSVNVVVPAPRPPSS